MFSAGAELSKQKVPNSLRPPLIELFRCPRLSARVFFRKTKSPDRLPEPGRSPASLPTNSTSARGIHHAFPEKMLLREAGPANRGGRFSARKGGGRNCPRRPTPRQGRNLRQPACERRLSGSARTERPATDPPVGRATFGSTWRVTLPRQTGPPRHGMEEAPGMTTLRVGKQQALFLSPAGQKGELLWSGSSGRAR